MKNPNLNNLTCPPSHDFHACPPTSGTTKFIGCCEPIHQPDPCNTGCDASNLAPASFPPELYGDPKFLKPSCPRAAEAYTCNEDVGGEQNATFWGCCYGEVGGIDPCRTLPRASMLAGCMGHLVGAFLDHQDQLEGYGLLSSTSSSVLESSTTTTDDPLSLQTLTTSTAAATATNNPEPKSTSTGVIAGSVVGGVVGLALLGVVLAYFVRHARRSRDEHQASVDGPSWRGGGVEEPAAKENGGRAELAQNENRNGDGIAEMESPQPDISPYLAQQWGEKGHPQFSPVPTSGHAGAANFGYGYADAMGEPKTAAVHEVDGSTVQELESRTSPSWTVPASPQGEDGSAGRGRWSTPA